MMTPKEKAEEIYNRFDMIIYTDQDHERQVYYCSKYFAESMVNEHFFDNDDTKLNYWAKVVLEVQKMK